jgi:hypothetical protein
MRKDKSTAVILNQLIQPEAILVPAKSENEGGGRAFVFEAEDYATGALLKATFAVRFKVEPVAAEFQKTYVEAQERNRSVFALEAAAARASSSAAAAAAAAAGTSGGISQAALNAASTPVSVSSSAAAGGSGAGATPSASRQEEVGHVQPLTDALLAATDMGAVPTIKEEEEGEGDDEADDDGESAVTAEPPTVLVVEGGSHGADRGTASTAPTPIKVSAAPAPGTSGGSSGSRSSNDSPAAASKAGSEASSGGTILVLVLVGAAAVAGLVWADGKGLLEGPKAEARKALQAAREAVQAHLRR